MFGRHAPHRFACTEKTADHVRGQNALPAVDCHVFHPHLALEHAGVVHERGDAAERRIDLLEHAQDIGLDADITRKHKNLVYVQTLKLLQTAGRPKAPKRRVPDAKPVRGGKPRKRGSASKS